MEQELHHRLTAIEDAQRGLKQGMAALEDRARQTTELLMKLLDVLDPQPKPQQGGMTVQELLALLIQRLDQQATVLRDVGSTISRTFVDLPMAVAEALHDNPPGSGR